MSAERQSQLDRLSDLLSTRATEPLLPGADRELDVLLSEFPEEDGEALDYAAAAVDLAYLSHVELEPMPDSLCKRIETDAIAFAAESRGMMMVAPSASSYADQRETPLHPARRAPLAGWPWLAAAACLLLAALAWWPHTQNEPNAADLYSQISATSSATTIAWSDPGDLGVTGDIVWDQASQRGVMRLRGLAANDPSTLQYQLWIFDKQRKSSVESGIVFNAVDGGVFDIEADTGDVFITVDPKLLVFAPTLFAITTEPPGGVVKHVTRGEYRIILAAPVPDSV